MDDTKLNRILDDLRTDVNDLLTKSYTSSEVSLDALQDQLSTLSTHFYSLENEMSSLVASITANTVDIASLKKENTNNQTQLDNLQTQTDNLQAVLSAHTQEYATHKQEFETQKTQVNQIQQTTLDNFNALKEFFEVFLTETEKNSATTNLERITALKEYFSTLKNHLETYNSTYFTAISQQIDSLQTRLDALQNSYTELAQTITTLSSNMDSLTPRVENLENDYQIMQNSITTINNNIQKYLTPADPYYVGKSFSDYPAGTIVQTYDCYEQIFELEHASTVSTPIIYFCAEPNSSATIRAHIEFFEYNQYDNVLAKVYVNDVAVCLEKIDVADANTSYSFDTALYGIALNETERGNNIYITISPEGYTFGDRNTQITKVVVEIIAPNVEIINKPMHFNAEHLNGVYYLSDTTTGYAKIAQINSNEMHNMDNLTWTDTDIKCLTYKTVGAVTKYQSNFTLDKFGYFYMDMSNNGHVIYPDLYDARDNLSVWMDWCANNDNAPHFVTLRSSGANYINIITPTEPSSYKVYSGKQTTNLAKVVGLRCAGDYGNENTTQYVNISIDINGIARLNASYNPSSSYSFELGYFTDATLYLHDYEDSKKYYLTCYLKKFDKIIKKEIEYNNKVFSLLDTVEIGAYDKFFQMSNNDYFVIKNNQLNYHKFEEDEIE